MIRVFRYNSEKNEKLKAERGVGFEEIIEVIESDIIEIRHHHNPDKYPNQKLMYVKYQNEVYEVPYVIEKDGTIFLKTLFPSRKARKKFAKQIKDNL